MKTLQQEIVEALRDAAPYLDEKSEATINKLAAKVESARCENCEYWEKEGSFQLRKCSVHDEDRQFQDFCWNFTNKVI